MTTLSENDERQLRHLAVSIGLSSPSRGFTSSTSLDQHMGQLSGSLSMAGRWHEMERSES